MKTTIKSGIAGLGLLATLAAGCGTTFDREGSIEEIMEGGFSRSAAECIVDRTVEELGEDRVTSEDDPTPEEAQLFGEIALECANR